MILQLDSLEQTEVIKCSRCGQEGHKNAKTNICPENKNYNGPVEGKAVLLA